MKKQIKDSAIRGCFIVEWVASCRNWHRSFIIISAEWTIINIFAISKCSRTSKTRKSLYLGTERWFYFGHVTTVFGLAFGAMRLFTNTWRRVLTAKLLVSISKLVAPPLDKVVRHGGVYGGCRSSQRFVARHALRSRTHPAHFKRAADLLFQRE